MAAGRGPPAAAALTVLLSLGASVPGLLRGAPLASLRPAALRAGEVHRLVTYIFVYEDLTSLACGAVIIWYFGGSFEKNFGTVKHCFLTLAFAVLSALLFLLLGTIVSRVSQVEDAKGFLPVAFAMLGVSSTRSQVKRTLFFGVRVPVVLVPWFLLSVAWFIPHSSLLGNLSGLLVGKAYGLSCCSCLDFPESVGSKLDHVFPFSLLKRIPGLKYIPGALAERRAFEGSKRINPVPGTYPTQSCHCPSPPVIPTFQLQHLHSQSCNQGHEGSQKGHAAGHSLPPSPHQARGAFREPLMPGASPGHCCQLGKSSAPQHVCPVDPQAATGLGPLAGVPEASGHPAAAAAPVSAEFLSVQVY